MILGWTGLSFEYDTEPQVLIIFLCGSNFFNAFAEKVPIKKNGAALSLPLLLKRNDFAPIAKLLAVANGSRF